MRNVNIYISHDSALYFWRTNPSAFLLEGADRNIRTLACCPASRAEYQAFDIPELEFGPDPIDVLVPLDASRCNTRMKHHVQTAKLPPHALYPIRDGIFVVSPELCLIEQAAAMSRVELLQLAMEFCGSYALRPLDDPSYAPRDYCLTTPQALTKAIAGSGKLKGCRMARGVLAYLAPNSASPMETKVYLLLCLPQKHGGYNLERPLLNHKLELDATEHAITGQWSIVPDMLWEDAKLVVEYDGEQHSTPEGMAKDRKRDVVLEGRGYTVVRISKQQLFDPVAFDAIAQTIARRLGKRVRPLSLGGEYAREQLRRDLEVS